MNWSAWLQDSVTVLLNDLSRIAAALKRIADAAEKEVERDG